jgi:hypothetical protein
MGIIFVVKYVGKIYQSEKAECNDIFIDFHKAFFSTFKDGYLFKIKKNRRKWEGGKMYEKNLSRYKILCEVRIEWSIQLWHSN